jgi:phosphoribosyl 1,2-cyclic phosphodiesterase
MRYGGNTACVAVEVPGEDPVVFDIGTGLRFWGQHLPTDGSFHGSALVSHMHWDHVQGLPFFVPADRVGATFDVYGPTPEECSWGEGFHVFMRPPYFPVTPLDLRGEIRFHDLNHDGLVLGNAKVTSRPVPHIGPTNGYRIEWDGVSICYISDHQAPYDQQTIHPNVLELADGVDLLIHDAQYTPEEWEVKSHWGHCTVDYAVHVAKEAGAKSLVLFHHDPAHNDDEMDRLLDGARKTAAKLGVDEVVAASEGLTISYERG